MSTAKTQLIDQITTACPSIRKVAGIADATAVFGKKIPLTKTPAAYVFRQRHTAADRAYMSEDTQKLDIRFVILLVFKHAGDTATGAKLSDQVDEVLEDLHLGVRSFTPIVENQTHEKFRLIDGQQAQWLDDRLVWQEVVATQMTQH